MTYGGIVYTRSRNGRSHTPSRTAARVAAAIILAIWGGHLLGEYGQSPSTPDVPMPQEKPRYVAALGFEWSSELTLTVLDEETTPGEVNPQ